MAISNPPVVQLATLPGSALVLSVPHAGTALSENLRSDLNEQGLALIDTDWHMDKIALDAAKGRASVLAAQYSRYMLDVNRPKEDAPLYAGATTGLISTIDFDGRDIYRAGQEPDAVQTAQRLADYWEPYHTGLRRLIDQVKARHGYCLLLDCHSIRSEVPRLFDGVLPDINIGTNDGHSADPALVEQVMTVCAQGPYDHVLNGRFKGGYITRHYGQPVDNVHAIQIEIAQKIYMEERAPWELKPKGAAELVAFIGNIADAMIGYGRARFEQGIG